MSEDVNPADSPAGWHALVPAIKESISYNKGLTRPEARIALPLGMALFYGIGITLVGEVILAGLNALDGVYPWHVLILHLSNILAALGLIAGASIAAAVARRLDRLPVMIVGLATFSVLLLLVQLALVLALPDVSSDTMGIYLVFFYWVTRNSLRIKKRWSILVAVFLLIMMVGASMVLFLGTAEGQALFSALRQARS